MEGTEKKVRRERGFASRSHILQLDIVERSFVSSAKLGYESAVCLEKGCEERGRERGRKCARVPLTPAVDPYNH